MGVLACKTWSQSWKKWKKLQAFSFPWYFGSHHISTHIFLGFHDLGLPIGHVCHWCPWKFGWDDGFLDLVREKKKPVWEWENKPLNFILFYFIFILFFIKTFSPPMCEILCILELSIGRRIQWCKNEFLGVPRFAFICPVVKIQQLWVVDWTHWAGRTKCLDFELV
jgi:hypothetical protein